jgi:MFS superfamily sulfate permease-like transporter
LLGILRGVVLAALFSLLVLLKGTSRPTLAALGRMPSTGRYSEVSRHPEAEEKPGLFVFRVDAAVLYFNADYIRQSVKREARDRNAQLVVFDMSGTARVDVAGVNMLSELSEELMSEGREFRLAETRGSIRELLRKAGFEKLVKGADVQHSVDEVLRAETRAASAGLA